MYFKLLGVAAICGLVLSACATTNTTPISPDVFRLDTTADGSIWGADAGSQTLLKAAQITQAHGYTYFKVMDGNSAASQQYSGQTAGFVGGVLYSAPTYTPTQNVSITVQMFNDPKPDGAWSAAEVIAKKGKMF